MDPFHLKFLSHAINVGVIFENKVTLWDSTAIISVACVGFIPSSVIQLSVLQLSRLLGLGFKNTSVLCYVLRLIYFSPFPVWLSIIKGLGIWLEVFLILRFINYIKRIPPIKEKGKSNTEISTVKLLSNKLVLFHIVSYRKLKRNY